MTAIINKKKAEKLKEELRKLSQHEDNKTCFVCGMRGPLYVVLDFSTFVCSTCSAVHRSLQHKVKGISMSEFTEGEVSVLRIGGNAKAATIWKQNYRGPNVAVGDETAAREMIRQVFVERRYLNAPALQQQEEAALHASLPPLTVLKSLDEIPMSGVPSRTTEASAAPSHAAFANAKVGAATPTPPSAASALPKATVDGLDFFEAQPTPPPAPPAPSASTAASQPAGDDFENFFGGRSGGGSTAATSTIPGQGGGSSRGGVGVGVGDLFGPSVTAPPAASAPSLHTNPSPSAQDFFGAPHTAASHSKHPQHDFFSASADRPAPTSVPFHTPPVASQPPPTYSNPPHHARHSGGQDFFQAASWEPNRVAAVATEGPALPFSAPPPQPPTRTAVAHATNAFADLDPFQGKRR